MGRITICLLLGLMMLKHVCGWRKSSRGSLSFSLFAPLFPIFLSALSLFPFLFVRVTEVSRWVSALSYSPSLLLILPHISQPPLSFSFQHTIIRDSRLYFFFNFLNRNLRFIKKDFQKMVATKAACLLYCLLSRIRPYLCPLTRSHHNQLLNPLNTCYLEYHS